MLTSEDLYQFQKYAVNHIIRNPGAMVWMDIGLGKTIVSLTAIEYLLDSFQARGALVVATKKIVEAVWQQEAKKWEHTKWLKVVQVTGTAKQRKEALKQKADVYLINYENLQWLQKTTEKIFPDGPLPFDIVVFDEVSKMKNSTAKRSEAYDAMRPYFKRKIGLTGTPAANGYLDLHGQYLAVDDGRRLGPYITSFRDRWFILNSYTNKYNPRVNAPKQIRELISDITIQMDAKDYLELPDIRDIDLPVTPDQKVWDAYKKFEEEYYIEIAGKGLEAFSSSAKSMKCRQLANGAVYVDEDRAEWELFHNHKLDLLEEILSELNGEPLLLCYQFRHDKERILKRFGGTVIDSKVDAGKIVSKWNDGKIKLLIGHPASMGHGLNLQYGGCNICWFGLPWSLELYQQAIGRLLRNGQSKMVRNYRLLMAGTIEDAISRALVVKGSTQDELRSAVQQAVFQRHHKN
jgi:SNF2 family DNA or RNA helicase